MVLRIVAFHQLAFARRSLHRQYRTMLTRPAVAADTQIVFIINLVLAGGGQALFIIIEYGIARTTRHRARFYVALGNR